MYVSPIIKNNMISLIIYDLLEIIHSLYEVILSHLIMNTYKNFLLELNLIFNNLYPLFNIINFSINKYIYG